VKKSCQNSQLNNGRPVTCERCDSKLLCLTKFIHLSYYSSWELEISLVLLTSFINVFDSIKSKLSPALTIIDQKPLHADIVMFVFTFFLYLLGKWIDFDGTWHTE